MYQNRGGGGGIFDNGSMYLNVLILFRLFYGIILKLGKIQKERKKENISILNIQYKKSCVEIFGLVVFKRGISLKYYGIYTGPRSNKQLFWGTYYSLQKNLAGNVILWECIKHLNKNPCSARIKTLNSIHHGRAPDHRCQPEILSGAVARQNQEVLACLLKKEALKRYIRHSRQVANVLPPAPQVDQCNRSLMFG